MFYQKRKGEEKMDRGKRAFIGWRWEVVGAHVRRLLFSLVMRMMEQVAGQSRYQSFPIGQTKANQIIIGNKIRTQLYTKLYTKKARIYYQGCGNLFH